MGKFKHGIGIITNFFDELLCNSFVFLRNSTTDARAECEAAEEKCKVLAQEIKEKENKEARMVSQIETVKAYNEELCNKLASLEVQKEPNKEEEKSMVRSILQPYFTDGQIRCIIEGRKWVKWSIDDYAAAISLRSVSPKAYRYLQKKLNFPLPSFSSLRRWALTKFDISEGFLKDVLRVMKEKSKSLSEMERIGVITFDEMSLSHEMCFDSKLEKMIGPCSKVQVIMVRGLFANWKQPIYYKFDQPMRKSILMEAISLLHEAGYHAVATTCDMGNKGIWKELRITKENYSFPHPTIADATVFVFADVPHLLKLLRNWFFDDGFNVPGCKEKLTSAALQRIVDVGASADLRVAHRLTQSVLDARNTLRQAVWPAARVWSRSVAKSVLWAGKHNLLNIAEYQQLSDFILMVNDWFDVHNSQRQFGEHQGVAAYGVSVENQDRTLLLMSSYMQNMRVGKRKTLMPFQEGIIISNSSLRGLHNYLMEKYPEKYKYLITRRLQQDILENFFSYIRGMGATRDHPSGYDFRYRLRWYILGKHSQAVFSNNRNSQEDTSSFCLSSNSLKSTVCTAHSCKDDAASISDQNLIEDQPITSCNADPKYEYEPNPQDLIVLTEELFAEIINISPESSVEEAEDIDHSEIETNYIENDDDVQDAVSIQYVGVGQTDENIPIGCLSANDLMQEAGLKYVAGYVAHRFRSKYTFLGEPTRNVDENSISTDKPDWLHMISRGNLLIPSKELMTLAIITEKCFNHFHGKTFSSEDKVVQKVVNMIKQQKEFDVRTPEEVLQCLVRTRTYIRLRNMNKQIYVENEKRKADKKKKKFPKIAKTILGANQGKK